MKCELATALVAAGLVLAPLAGHAAEGQPMKLEMAKEVIDDATVTSRVRDELARDKVMGASKIRVDTAKGVVRLTGDVKTKADAEKAAALAKNAPGVARVQNDLRVTGK